jgi:hypothetical protein
MQRNPLGDPRIDCRWICSLRLIVKGTESSTWRSIHHFVQSGLFDPNRSLEDNAFELYSKVRLVRADLRSIEDSELAWDTPGLAAAYEVKLQRSDGVQRYDESNDDFRWRELDAIRRATAEKHAVPVDLSDRLPTELAHVVFFVEQPQKFDDDVAWLSIQLSARCAAYNKINQRHTLLKLTPSKPVSRHTPTSKMASTSTMSTMHDS